MIPVRVMDRGSGTSHQATHHRGNISHRLDGHSIVSAAYVSWDVSSNGDSYGLCAGRSTPLPVHTWTLLPRVVQQSPPSHVHINTLNIISDGGATDSHSGDNAYAAPSHQSGSKSPWDYRGTGGSLAERGNEWDGSMVIGVDSTHAVSLSSVPQSAAPSSASARNAEVATRRPGARDAETCVGPACAEGTIGRGCAKVSRSELEPFQSCELRRM